MEIQGNKIQHQGIHISMRMRGTRIFHLSCNTSLVGKIIVHWAVNDLGSAWQRSFTTNLEGKNIF